MRLIRPNPNTVFDMDQVSSVRFVKEHTPALNTNFPDMIYVTMHNSEVLKYEGPEAGRLWALFCDTAFPFFPDPKAKL